MLCEAVPAQVLSEVVVSSDLERIALPFLLFTVADVLIKPIVTNHLAWVLWVLHGFVMQNNHVFIPVVIKYVQ